MYYCSISNTKYSKTPSTLHVSKPGAPHTNAFGRKHGFTLYLFLTLFRFDFSLVVGIGCLFTDSYFTSLSISFSVVLLIVTIVAANYLWLKMGATGEGQL